MMASLPEILLMVECDFWTCLRHFKCSKASRHTELFAPFQLGLFEGITFLRFLGTSQVYLIWIKSRQACAAFRPFLRRNTGSCRASLGSLKLKGSSFFHHLGAAQGVGTTNWGYLVLESGRFRCPWTFLKEKGSDFIFPRGPASVA